MEFDDKRRTGVEYFDQNNSRLVDLLNELYESFLKNDGTEEYLRIFREIGSRFETTVRNEQYLMNKFSYDNAEYLKNFQLKQLKELEKIHTQLRNRTKPLSLKILEELSFILRSNISWSNNYANFLKNKYKDKVREILDLTAEPPQNGDANGSEKIIKSWQNR